MPSRGTRIAGCAIAIMTVLPLSACGDDEPTSLPVVTSATPSASVEDEAVAVLEAYWAERVRVETSGNYDSANFDGILAPAQIEPLRQRYRQFDEGGFHRTGKPELRDFVAEVDGSSAIASVCVNEDEWGAEADGKVVPPEPQGWFASSHTLELKDGAWLIVGDAQTPESVSC